MAERLSEWSCADVADWLNEEGFGNYADVLCNQHKIDGQTLLVLSEDDLKQPPIKMSILGDIKRIMSKINQLRAKDPDFLAGLNINSFGGVDLSKSHVHSYSSLETPYIEPPTFDQRLVQSSQLLTSDPFACQESRCSRDLDSELWKTLLSFVYVFSVFLLTAFVMVIVHDRVPDMQKYPPLPDLFLDNMPYVPWAFQACELVGLCLSILWVTVLIFHKHR